MSELQNWLLKLQADSSSIKLGLSAINNVAKILQLNKPAPFVITVAGTNGKGTVVRLLEELFFAHGFNVGCYTSPHLVNFNERICVNKQQVCDQEIIASFKKVTSVLDKHNLNLTFFEFITVSAWLIFQQQKLDIVILEIGMGGRLDAVNAIKKDIAVITSIDLDHKDFLGENIEKIGYEKAGIIEDNIPVVLGSSEMPDTVLTKANSCAKLIRQFSKDYSLITNNDKLLFSSQSLPDEHTNISLNIKSYNNLKLNNIATSIEVIRLVDKFYKNFIDYQKVSRCVSDFNLIGRCSWLKDYKNILLDVAHNPQSVNNLKQYVSDYIEKNTNIKNVYAICGMLSDKDIDQCLKIISPLITSWSFLSLDGPRAALASDLSLKLSKINNKANSFVFNNITECYRYIDNFIINNYHKNSILIIFGSFHIVGPIYEYIYPIGQ